jgi:hypothetical protein
MSGVYDFNQDSERVRWLKTAMPAHGRAMLDRWRSEKQKQVGFEEANKWMLDLIKQAKEI